jgi:hypothetical protein
VGAPENCPSSIKSTASSVIDKLKKETLNYWQYTGQKHGQSEKRSTSGQVIAARKQLAN